MTEDEILAAARRLPQVFDHPRLSEHLQRMHELGLTVSGYVFSTAPDAPVLLVIHDKNKEPNPATLVSAFREHELLSAKVQGHA